MQTTMQGISNKAKLKPEHRFQNLYRILNEEMLEKAFYKLKNGKAAGVDNISKAAYEVNLKTNIEEVVEQLKRKSYKAKLVKRVHISKERNKTRPLGMPAVSDKLVQTVVAEVLTVMDTEEEKEPQML